MKGLSSRGLKIFLVSRSGKGKKTPMELNPGSFFNTEKSVETLVAIDVRSCDNYSSLYLTYCRKKKRVRSLPSMGTGIMGRTARNVLSRSKASPRGADCRIPQGTLGEREIFQWRGEEITSLGMPSTFAVREDSIVHLPFLNREGKGTTSRIPPLTRRGTPRV